MVSFLYLRGNLLIVVTLVFGSQEFQPTSGDGNVCLVKFYAL